MANERKRNRRNGAPPAGGPQIDYVRTPIEQLLELLKSSNKGLTQQEAEARLEKYGHNEPARRKRRTIFIEISSKFANPLVAVLLIIGAISLALGERASAVVVIALAALSVAISFFQEHRASRAAEKLRQMVRTTATVLRDGRPQEIATHLLVPGDVVDLYAGDMIPADLRIFSAKDLFVNQAALTGEAFPLEKVGEPVEPRDGSVNEMRNVAFMGSSVVSGTGLGLVVKTGLATQFGEISRRLAAMHVETSFDRGVRRFTWLMIRLMLVMVVAIFGINAALKGNWVQALMFSLAVAVGLTPEMLPMLVAVNLSKGAIAMSGKKVIVKRLNAIQNFGAMDVLCTDKTGTLTLNEIVLERHCDVLGNEDEDVLRYAYVNSFYQTGLKNLLDKAILKHQKLLIKEFRKVDEIPFDFTRRIMSVVIESEASYTLIAKGAHEEVMARCAGYEIDGKILPVESQILDGFREKINSLHAEGFRVLAVAYKDVGKKDAYSKDDEKGLVLKGYVAFLDPPKPTARKALEALKMRGVETIVLTGDNELVTKKICTEVGIDVKGMISGELIDKASDIELRQIVKTTTVYARLNPVQKERIIRALRDNGHTVGYLGDGINDAPSLKTSDVGISVNNAVDIAKESADIILLEKSLMVLDDGVVEGRKIFGNILKYIKMGASSNFGNMFSMLGASIFLPFLPMTPIQILLNNFLYDMSQIAIPTDKVDEEYIEKPRPWNIDYIKRYMITIGPISSIFDYVTFGALWFVFGANTIAQQALFHTGWFLESLCTQTLVIYVIRTGKIPFIESTPSKLLIATSLSVIGIGLFLPYSPLAEEPFGFVQPPPLYFAALAGIIIAYLVTVQYVKKWFIRKYGYE